MNYTTNYHLPQWVKEDRIMMDDFNRAMADIEKGLVNAQTVADAARQTANTAHTEATTLPYAVGTYTGTGADMTIKVGFRPRFLIISSQPDAPSLSQLLEFNQCSVITGGNTVCRRVQFTKNGFTVKAQEYYEYPDLTIAGRVYDYIAFK